MLVAPADFMSVALVAAVAAAGSRRCTLSVSASLPLSLSLSLASCLQHCEDFLRYANLLNGQR